MKRSVLILLNATFLAVVIVAATYAVVVQSKSASVSINIVASGVTAYSSCPNPSGPTNPISSISLGQLQIGGTHILTFYLVSVTNGTVNLAWNSTLQSGLGLSDSLTLGANWRGGSGFSYTPYPPIDAGNSFGNYELAAPNCGYDGNTGFQNWYPFASAPSINGVVLTQGFVRQVAYTIKASTLAAVGSYSWVVNVGVE